MDRRKFITHIGCGCCGFVLNACSSAPITERRQLKIIPEAKLNAQAAQIYEKVKKENLVMIQKNLMKLRKLEKIENSISEYFQRENLNDPTVNFEWEYILIDNNKIKNAKDARW